MAVIALTSVNRRNALPYLEAIENAVPYRRAGRGAADRIRPPKGYPGLEVRLLIPGDSADVPTEELMAGVAGLLLSGGPDVDPARYRADPDPEAGLYLDRALDDLEFRVLDYALHQDMPVLAICRGMQLLNVAFGGQLIQDLPGHKAHREDGRWVSESHQIYLAPGSKAAPIIGSAGFFRVNSRHHQGVREPQKAPRLMATAYSVEDGYIEGLESPEHSWVIGVQCHPERQDEVPASFANLFRAFGDRAEDYADPTHVTVPPARSEANHVNRLAGDTAMGSGSREEEE